MSKGNKQEYYLYKEFSIPHNLSGIFSRAWYFKATSLAPGDKRFNVLPGSSQCLLIIYPLNFSNNSLFLCGPADKYICITEKQNVTAAGFVFEPGVLNNIFGVHPSETYNSKYPLSKLINKKTMAQLFIALKAVNDENEIINVVFKFFRELSGKSGHVNSETDNIIIGLIREIRKAGGNVKLNDLYSKINISKRQVQRLFNKFTGLSPKEFCRLERFQTASDRLVSTALSSYDILFSTGYYDQAHFNREFRKLTGIAPKRFREKQKRINRP